MRPEGECTHRHRGHVGDRVLRCAHLDDDWVALIEGHCWPLEPDGRYEFVVFQTAETDGGLRYCLPGPDSNNDAKFELMANKIRKGPSITRE